MRQFVLSVFVFVSITAFGAKYEVIHLNAAKQVISPEQAMLDGLQKKPVYVCKTAEFGISKSGTSGSLKNTKKPKSDAEIEKMIEELKKQKESNQ